MLPQQKASHRFASVLSGTYFAFETVFENTILPLRSQQLQYSQCESHSSSKEEEIEENAVFLLQSYNRRLPGLQNVFCMFNFPVGFTDTWCFGSVFLTSWRAFFWEEWRPSGKQENKRIRDIWKHWKVRIFFFFLKNSNRYLSRQIQGRSENRRKWRINHHPWWSQ